MDRAFISHSSHVTWRPRSYTLKKIARIGFPPSVTWLVSRATSGSGDSDFSVLTVSLFLITDVWRFVYVSPYDYWIHVLILGSKINILFLFFTYMIALMPWDFTAPSVITHSWSSGRGRTTVQLDDDLVWACWNASCSSSDYSMFSWDSPPATASSRRAKMWEHPGMTLDNTLYKPREDRIQRTYYLGRPGTCCECRDAVRTSWTRAQAPRPPYHGNSRIDDRLGCW